jgi:hypothetical protein
MDEGVEESVGEVLGGVVVRRFGEAWGVGGFGGLMTEPVGVLLEGVDGLGHPFVEGLWVCEGFGVGEGLFESEDGDVGLLEGDGIEEGLGDLDPIEVEGVPGRCGGILGGDVLLEGVEDHFEGLLFFIAGEIVPDLVILLEVMGEGFGGCLVEGLEEGLVLFVGFLEEVDDFV